ncbi:hypothetical protein D1BOALGB6SA_5483 [Olavius sp. associated proteobacterium Delta 1]|nr:hypothetical protein D1BOALGB6SA_5483 [Olavius sp. associated proteobacterium Delta 1]
MVDSGLMAFLLSWKMDPVRLDSDRSAKLIETFAFNEIMAQVDASDGRYELFHYRDREKREIDFLIKREDNALLGCSAHRINFVISQQSHFIYQTNLLYFSIHQKRVLLAIAIAVLPSGGITPGEISPKRKKIYFFY